jgi:Fe-S-cluster containining protein
VNQASDRASPWYAEGLRFACQRCGNCCTGSGSVRVSDVEIERLAARVEMTNEEFRIAYTRRLRGGDVSLRETRSKDCVFFDRARGCRVYSDRPRQCRSWPFWRNVIHTSERWSEEAQDCPGMNRGELHSAAEISEIAREDGTSGVIRS